MLGSTVVHNVHGGSLPGELVVESPAFAFITVMCPNVFSVYVKASERVLYKHDVVIHIYFKSRGCLGLVFPDEEKWYIFKNNVTVHLWKEPLPPFSLLSWHCFQRHRLLLKELKCLMHRSTVAWSVRVKPPSATVLRSANGQVHLSLAFCLGVCLITVMEKSQMRCSEHRQPAPGTAGRVGWMEGKTMNI